MEDSGIVALYLARDQRAVEETKEKYDSFLDTIARRILGDPLDAAEVVNDTYLAAWNSIPPQKPAVLSSYLAKLTRRIAMKVWRSRDAAKRGGGETALSLEELQQCIPGGRDPEEEVSAKELGRTIDAFLRRLPENERRVFLRRYFYGASIREIGQDYGFTNSKVETMLFRTRKKLKEHLAKEGYLNECRSAL